MLSILFALAVICALGADPSAYNAYSDQRPTADALELAGQVNKALVSECRPNCPTIAMFRNTTAPNAMLIDAPGQAKFVYQPEFFTRAYEVYGEGGIMAIIAHAVGHAIDRGPVSWMNKNWDPELRADAWAGCALARVNLSSRTLKSGLSALAKYPSTSQPNWDTRVPVLRAGFTQCGGDRDKFDSAIRK